jgi:hypothetical protein
MSTDGGETGRRPLLVSKGWVQATLLVVGAIPVLYIAYIGIRHTVKRVTLEEPEDILFTEVVEPEGVSEIGADEATAAKTE